MTKSLEAPRVVSLGLERLKSLPLSHDVWQLGFERLPTWITEDRDKPFRPLLAICHSAAADKVGGGDICAPGDPMRPIAMAAVAQLATTKGVGYRPRCVEVRDPLLAEAVREDLAACGIEVALVERLDALDAVFADMLRRMGGERLTTRFFDPAIEIAVIGGFAEAAAVFYNAAPWNLLTDADLIVVASPDPPKGLGCFTVLGAGGIERGLGFFHSSAAFERFTQSEPLDPRIAAPGLWLMSFSELVDWPIADSELWEQHGLPLAGERDYPSLVCHTPKGGTKPADAEHLAFVEALLRALASTTEDELDCGHWSKSVASSNGQVTIELSLPSIVQPRAGARRRRASSASELPDRRVMEQTLRDVGALLSSGEFGFAEELNAFLAKTGGTVPKRAPARTPQAKAQELIDRAFEESGRLRIKLAHEALKLWPDCAEAWVLKAEQMPDLERRATLYQNAVAAAERVLGPRPFVEEVGHFWGLLETRPYMRARNGLAGALWDRGEHDEAIAHWLDLLRLCPNDNLGVRGMLVPRLLEARRDGDAEEVLARYEDDATAELGYARALLEFRRSGAGPTAQAALDAAIFLNEHVPKYLSGRASMEGALPDSYRVGSDEEARIATAVLFKAWSSTEGALEWVARSLRPPNSERRARRAKGKQEKQGKRK